MYTYQIKYHGSRTLWDIEFGDYTVVILLLDGQEVGRWSYHNQPYWLSRRIKKIKKKYGATPWV